MTDDAAKQENANENTSKRRSLLRAFQRPRESALQQRSSRLHQAIDDVSLLVLYVAESENQANAELINNLITVQYAYDTTGTLTQQQQVDFWTNYSALSHACLPAVAEGVRHSARYRSRPFWTRVFLYPSLAIITMVTLVLYLIIQVYALTGSLAYDEFSKANADYEALLKTPLSAAQSQPVDIGTAILRLNSQTQFLTSWNSWWDWIDIHKAREAEWANTRYFLSIRTQVALTALNSYFLPLLLGILGSCTQVLRAVTQLLKQNSMKSSYLAVYNVRILLGAIAGVTIGLVLGPKNPPSFLATLPPMAFAFLVGYSIEVLFALLDRIVDDARDYVKPKK